MKNLNLYRLIYFRICSNLVNQEKHYNLYYNLAALCLNKDQGGTYTLETEIACRMQGWYGRLYGTYWPHISLPVICRHPGSPSCTNSAGWLEFTGTVTQYLSHILAGVDERTIVTEPRRKVVHSHWQLYHMALPMSLLHQLFGCGIEGLSQVFYIPDCSVIILRNVTRQVNYSINKDQNNSE